MKKPDLRQSCVVRNLRRIIALQALFVILASAVMPPALAGEPSPPAELHDPYLQKTFEMMDLIFPSEIWNAPPTQNYIDILEQKILDITASELRIDRARSIYNSETDTEVLYIDNGTLETDPDTGVNVTGDLTVEGQFTAAESSAIDFTLDTTGRTEANPSFIHFDPLDTDEVAEILFGDGSGLQIKSGNALDIFAENTLRLFGDRNGTVSQFSDESNIGIHIINTTADSAALVVDAAPEQTANLQEWRDDVGTILSYVDKDGKFRIGNPATPVATLDVEGDLRLAPLTDAPTCSDDAVGTIYYNEGDDELYLCNSNGTDPADWIVLTIDPMALSEIADKQLLYNNNGVEAGALIYYDNGKLGFSETIDANLALDLNDGYIGAGKYCKADGTDCKTIDELIAGASQWDDVTGGINYAGGKVGIGTATPNASLHVKTLTGTNAEIDLQTADLPHWALYQDETSQDLNFWNTANVLTLTNEGNVNVANTLDMTSGKITNLASPVDGTDAANKDYADTKLALSGGSMTGDIVFTGGKEVTGLPAIPSGDTAATSKKYVSDTYLKLAGGTMTGALSLSGNPTQPLHAVPLQYLGNYLPLSGGTLTGDLILPGNPANNLGAVPKSYVDGLITGLTWKPPVDDANGPDGGTPDDMLGTLACNATNESWATYNKPEQKVYVCNGADWVEIASTAGVPFATDSVPGKVQLSGDLNGTGGSYNNLQITAGAIVNADVNDNAAIAGTKVSPNFGSQNVVTTGSVSSNKILVDGADSVSTSGNNEIFENGGTLNLGARSSIRLLLDNDNTQTNASFQIGTDGNYSGLFHVSEDGNVGIGTITPTSLGGHTNMLNLYGSNATGITLGNSAGSGVHFTKTASDLNIRNTEAGSINFTTSDTSRMLINSSGNVGIGTASPSNRLHVLANAVQMRLGFDATNYTTFYSASNGQLQIDPSGGSMFVDGNVGINTTTPGQAQVAPISGVKLDVNGNQMLTSLSSTDSEQSKLFFFRSDGAIGSAGAPANGFKLGALEWVTHHPSDIDNGISAARIEAETTKDWSSGANRDAALTFSTVSANALTEKMRISATGDVGIGTTTPGAKLDVVGKIRSTSTVGGDSATTVTTKDYVDAAVSGALLQAGDKGEITVGTGGLDWTIDNGVIFDADVNAAAAIAGTKINPNFGTQNIVTTGTISAAGGTFTGDILLPADPDAALEAVTKQYVDNKINGLTWKDPVEDDDTNPVTGAGTAGPIAKYAACNTSKESWATYNKNDRIIYVCSNNTWVQMSSTVGIPNLAGEVTGPITGNIVADNVIDNANIKADAAIDGTKIVPNFGSQNVVTTGSLGVGTATPESKLHVNGGGIKFQSDSGAGTGAGNLSFDSNTKALTLYNDYANDASRINFDMFFGSQKTIMSLLRSGYVGIGTASPTDSLHIYRNTNNATTALKIQNESTTGSAAELILGTGIGTDNGGGIKYTTASNELSIYNNRKPDSEISFTTRQAGGAVVEALRLDSNQNILVPNGNVGIGTTTPAAKLDVAGKINSASTVEGDAGTIVTTKDYVDDAVSNATLDDGDKEDITVSGDGLIWNIDPGVITNTEISDTAAIAGTKIAPDFGSQNVVTTGKIGAGTATPIGALEVRSLRLPNTALIVSGNNNAEGTRFYTTDTTAIMESYQAEATGNFGNILMRMGSLPGHTPKFQISNYSGGSDQYLMTVNSTGNVGIGTIAPEAPLHIKTGAGYNAEINLQTDNHPKWAIYQTEDDDGTTEGYDESIDLTFWNTENRMVLSNDGRLGIGTMTPGALLDVNGDAIIRGNLDMENGTISNLATPFNSGDAVNLGYLQGLIIDEDDMASNLDTKVPTQQSVRSYVIDYVQDRIDGLTWKEPVDDADGPDGGTPDDMLGTLACNATNESWATYNKGENMIYVCNGTNWVVISAAAGIPDLDGEVTGSLINTIVADNVIDSANIINGTITGADIANATIALANLADNSVNSAKIVNGTIATIDIADGAIDTNKILNNTILNVDLADNIISSAKIIDDTITNADIKSDAAIAGTKISPNFGAQQITTTGNLTLPSLTGSRLLATDGTKNVVTTGMHQWLAGTVNQINVSDDGDGTATLGLPQNIHSAATPTFAGMTLSGLTTNGVVTSTGGVLGSTAVLSPAMGGTGLNASGVTDGQILIGNDAGNGFSLGTLGAGSGINITNSAGGISIASTLGTSVDLTAEVNGILPLANGGTGANTFTAGAIPFSTGTVLSEDTTKFFWDNTKKALAIGSGTVSGTLAVDVTGNVGATKFCDADGNNCYTTSELLAGQTQWDDVTGGINYAGGNVGIGTTSPAAKLDVIGDAIIRGILSMNNHKITNLADPVDGGDAVNKTYVDDKISGLTWKPPVETGETDAATKYGACDSTKESWATYNKNDRVIYVCSNNAWVEMSNTVGIPDLDGEVTGPITSSIVADNVIDSANLIDGTIVAADLADDAVTSAKIMDEAVATADLGDNAVTTLKLADGAVTSNKIFDGTIATVDIADNAITSAKMADNAIGTAEITDGSIMNADVNAAAAIDGTKISPNFGAQNVVTTGSLGVGTTNPLAKLHVVGQHQYFFSNAADNNLKAGRNENEYISLFVPDGGGQIVLKQDETDQNQNFIFNIENNTTAERGYIFRSNSTDLLHIKKDGKVGMGTSSPTSALQVVGGIVSGQPLNNAITSGLSIKQSANTNINGVILESSSSTRNGALYHNGSGVTLRENAVDTLTAQAGNVGIGTATPNAKLHVKTDAGTNSEIDIQSGTSPHWAMYQDDTTDDLNFWNTANVMTLTNEGNVSINNALAIGGKATSASTLDADGATTLTTKDYVDTKTAEALLDDGDKEDITVTGNGLTWNIDAGVVGTTELADGSINNAKVSASAAIDGTKISPNFGSQNVVTTGSIGVGTTNPTEKLQIVGGSILLDNTRGIQVKDNAGTDRMILSYTSANNTQLNNTASTGSIQLNNNNNSGAIKFNVGNPYIEAMTIKADGKIGIGTNAPAEKFEVAGNAKITGDLNMDSGKITNLATPTAATDAATMGYVDDKINGLTWKDPVNDDDTNPLTGSGENGPISKHGACEAAKESWATYNKNDRIIYVCNGTAWVQMSSTVGIPDLAGEVTGNITNTVVANNTIDSANIINSTIISEDIADGTIALADLADSSVNSAKIVDAAIATGDLADSAVTSAKIADGTIMNADVNAAAAIAGTKITPDFGTQNVLTTGNLKVGSGTAAYATSSGDVYVGDDLEVNDVIYLKNFSIDGNDKNIYIAEKTLNTDFESVAQVKIGPYLTLGNFGGGNSDFIGTNAQLDYSSITGGTEGTGNKFIPQYNTGKGVVMNSSFATGAWTWYGIDWGGSSARKTFPSDFTQIMTLNYTGNVGIGTSSPTAKLDVAGKIKSASTEGTDAGTIVTTKDYVDAKAAAVQLADGDKEDVTVTNNGLTWNLDAGVVGNDELAANAVTDAKVAANAAISGTKIAPNFGSQNVVTSGNLVVNTDNLYVDSSTGKVGIGTSSPTEKLEINGGRLKISGNANSTKGLAIGRYSTNSTFHIIESTANGLEIRPTFNENIIMSTGGNVGIGTATPGEKLEVVGKIKSSSTLAGDAGTTVTTKDYVDAKAAAAQVADGDKGDITVSVGGTVWNIDPDTVDDLAIDWGTGANQVNADDIPDGTTNKMFTATEQTKLAGIEALADVTDAENVDAAGAVMNTDTSTAAMQFVINESNLASASATKVPTQASVKAYVDNAINGLTWKAPVDDADGPTGGLGAYDACDSTKESWATYNKNNNLIYVCNGTDWVQMSSTVGIPDLAGEVTGPLTNTVVADNKIDSANIIDLAIATGDIADSAITSAKIAVDTIVAADIAAGAIGASELASNAVTNIDVSTTAAIAGTKIAPDFGTQNVATTGNLTIDTNTLFVDATTNKVGIGTVTPNALLHLKTAAGNAELDIQSGSAPHWAVYQDETSQDLNFWNVSNVMTLTNEGGVKIFNDLDMDGGSIANLPATPTNANDAASKAYVDSKAAAATLGDADKGDITVSGSGTVWSIDDSTVTSADIVDLTIATGDIADSAITSAKIAVDTIVAADIAAGGVGNSELASNAVTNVKVSATAAIDGTKISPNFGTQNVATTGNLTIDTNTLFVDATANAVGIGTATPQSTLDVNGGVRIGNDAAACTAQKDGTLRFGGTTWEYCDGDTTSWKSLASASGGNSWGTITGTLTDQTDLSNVLNAKLDKAGGSMTGDLTLGSDFIVKRTASAGDASSNNQTIIGVTDVSVNRTVTLSTADMADGKIIIIKDESGMGASKKITVATQGTEKIDGVDSIDIRVRYGVLRLYSNGSNWFSF